MSSLCILGWQRGKEQFWNHRRTTCIIAHANPGYPLITKMNNLSIRCIWQETLRSYPYANLAHHLTWNLANASFSQIGISKMTLIFFLSPLAYISSFLLYIPPLANGTPGICKWGLYVPPGKPILAIIKGKKGNPWNFSGLSTPPVQSFCSILRAYRLSSCTYLFDASRHPP